ncbi:MAG: VOC family protein [Halioglobus sp.]|nr:VOC family protein [Halioglobus sp.]
MAYIVNHIDDAIAHWNTEYGIGPFAVTRDITPFVNAVYRGRPGEVIVMDLAFAYIGDLQLELIALKNDVPSMYKEVLDRGQVDLQHYAVRVKDFEAAVACYEKNGFQAVVESGTKGVSQMHYVEAMDFDKNIFGDDEKAYMKTPEGFGIVLEVIEDNAMTAPYFDGIKQMVNAIPSGQLIQEFKISQLAPT